MRTENRSGVAEVWGEGSDSGREHGNLWPYGNFPYFDLMVLHDYQNSQNRTLKRVNFAVYKLYLGKSYLKYK